MTSSVLKIIAIITMIIDHTGKELFPKELIFTYIGRIAFPIFAFQISEGYIHTRNFKKYFYRLLIFAIVSQMPFNLFLRVFSDEYSLNIFFTLLLGLLSIYAYDIIIKKCTTNDFLLKKIFYTFLAFLSVIAIASVGDVLNVDYGFFGVFIIFLFYILKNKKILLTLTFILSCFLHYLDALISTDFYYPNIILCICTMIPIIFINLYNGKQGELNKKLKYVFYLVYPVHLLLLYSIYCILHIS